MELSHRSMTAESSVNKRFFNTTKSEMDYDIESQTMVRRSVSKPGHFRTWLQVENMSIYSKPIYQSKANPPQDTKIPTGHF